MSEARRREYLDALNIDVYTLRDAPAAVPEVIDADIEEIAPDWDTLRAQVSGCTRCPLHESRTQTVFGVGNPDADWMIIGEAPGMEEDRRGEPFVGRAGRLLDEMLLSLDLDRSKVFIANILKCRPPNNRDPSAEESTQCRRYLERQIELVKPKLVVAVGRIAAQQLLGTDSPVGRLRGRRHTLAANGLPLVVTYHPAYLLRSPTQKRKVWHDLLLARQVYGEAQ